MNGLNFNRYAGISAILALAFALVPACGSDDEKSGGGPDGGGEEDGGDGTGGNESGDASPGSGGKANVGGGGGSGGGGNVDGGGTGGKVVTPSSNPDDLVAAICDWEFRCCERGELDYRLGPTVTDEESCKDRFVFELRESNDANNPFVAGSPLGLLGTLGYQLDLTRVDVDPEGLGACIAFWEELDCAKDPPKTAPRCDGPPDPAANPCALDKIFKPKLAQGELCTLSLAENAVGNDIECVSGTTCLAGSHPDNPGENAACISRRVEGQPCSNDSKCDFGFYCSGTDGQCHEKGDVGDDCSFRDAEEPKPDAVEAACKNGLTCNPETLKCVASCTNGFTCTADAQCPDGSSCIPLTVGNDETSFKVCAPLGNSATDRCDTHEDCVPNNYCDAVCRPDVAISAACTVTPMCPAGTFCKFNFLAGGMSCELLGGPGDPCSDASECEPGANNCVYDGVSAANACSATKRAVDAPCGVSADCASGLCDASVAGMRCSAGAAAGDACDTASTDPTAPTCGAGLACIGGECVEQLVAGKDCTDPDADVPNSQLCANASCVEQWERTLCTDAPIPKANGGTGLTCDGKP